jgi:hypothetical protein
LGLRRHAISCADLARDIVGLERMKDLRLAASRGMRELADRARARFARAR